MRIGVGCDQPSLHRACPLVELDELDPAETVPDPHSPGADAVETWPSSSYAEAARRTAPSSTDKSPTRSLLVHMTALLKRRVR
jgi:hypothetical protein